MASSSTMDCIQRYVDRALKLLSGMRITTALLAETNLIETVRKTATGEHSETARKLLAKWADLESSQVSAVKNTKENRKRPSLCNGDIDSKKCKRDTAPPPLKLIIKRGSLSPDAHNPPDPMTVKASEVAQELKSSGPLKLVIKRSNLNMEFQKSPEPATLCESRAVAAEIERSDSAPIKLIIKRGSLSPDQHTSSEPAILAKPVEVSEEIKRSEPLPIKITIKRASLSPDFQQSPQAVVPVEPVQAPEEIKPSDPKTVLEKVKLGLANVNRAATAENPRTSVNKGHLMKKAMRMCGKMKKK